jgi:large subunit ribosomal protein L30
MAGKTGKVKVTQTGSPIGRPSGQRATLKALGLDKLNRSRELDDTPSIRGMLDKVNHLIRIEPVK